MEREILFRGKQKDNGEWAEGYYVTLLDEYHYILTGKLTIIKNFPVFENFCVIPETVGQYTGLTDKNGVKIFEGDIIKGDIPELFPKFAGRIGFVKYNKSAYIVDFSNRYPKWELEKVGFCSFVNYEVIGNIYDNPELLKGDR